MQQFKTFKLPCSEVKVRDSKTRDDLGDLKSLAQSIYDKGLLHPIILDSKGFLVSGQRRLTAIRDLLKVKEIECRQPIDKDGNALDLPDDTIKEMEIEENCQRKDLTWAEGIKTTKELHEIKQRLYGSSKTGANVGWGIKETAAFLGRSPGTISQDLQLAEALAENPELLKKENKTDAFKFLKKKEESAALKELVEAADQLNFKPSYLHFGDNLPWLKTLQTGTVHCLYTDPPYAIDLKVDGDVIYDTPDIPHSIFEQLYMVLKECYRILKDESHGYVWFAMQHYADVRKMLTDIGFAVNPSPLMWLKKGATAHCSPYTFSANYEPCFHILKGKREINKGNQSSWFLVDRVPETHKIHPTEKPIRLIIPMLEASTFPGETVLDPYAGSGSTLRACLACSRQPLGCEVKKEYYDATLASLIAFQAKTGRTKDGLKVLEKAQEGEKEEVV